MSATTLAGMFRGVEWWTTGRAARELGVSMTTIHKLVSSGRLSVRLVPGSKHRRLRADEVRALAERSYTPASA